MKGRLLKIAVIGSGISGLSAALLLSQQYEVHLFESENRPGGHAHTSSIKTEKSSIDVDTGFLVYNELTYPHLTALFKYLNVETVNSDMSLSIQVPHINLEWAGDNLDTVFAQRKNLLNLRFHKLLSDILRFHKEAERNRADARINDWTLAQLLKERKYSVELCEWYVLPMVAAIWSTPETDMLNFPAETFLTFFLNHKLLQVNDRPQWKTVKGGSKNYVKKISDRLQHVHLNEAVRKVLKDGEVLRLTTDTREYSFNKVVFATAPNITLKILQPVNEQVKKVLAPFQTIENKAQLHQDAGLMPQKRKCWASWCVRANLHARSKPSVSLSYYLNRLQPLNSDENFFLTLNPPVEPRNVLFQHTYHHPKFNADCIKAQSEVPSIQGLDNIYHVGAWTRYGFHEDGLLSAVKVAEKMGVTTPWPI